MKLTNELMYKTFEYLNDIIFGNEINVMPGIKVYTSKINMGYFEGTADEDNKPVLTIKISKHYNKDYNTFVATLAHEMVHCFQYLKHMPVDHGKAFKEMAAAIKKTIGIDIL